jgi:hypothetical protein
MTLGRQDLPVTAADRGPDVARLTAFLGNNHRLHQGSRLSGDRAAYRVKNK